MSVVRRDVDDDQIDLVLRGRVWPAAPGERADVAIDSVTLDDPAASPWTGALSPREESDAEDALRTAAFDVLARCAAGRR